MGTAGDLFPSGRKHQPQPVQKMCRDLVHEFDMIPVTGERRPRVGIVGEILVKFLPAANNHLAELLEAEGAEAVCPDLIDFISYCFFNQNFKSDYLGFKNQRQQLQTGESKESTGSAKPRTKLLSRAVIFPLLRISASLQKWLLLLCLREIRPGKAGS